MTQLQTTTIEQFNSIDLTLSRRAADAIGILELHHLIHANHQCRARAYKCTSSLYNFFLTFMFYLRYVFRYELRLFKHDVYLFIDYEYYSIILLNEFRRPA